MAEEPIGSVRVDIVADYSKFTQGVREAESQGAQAGAKIAAAFTAGVSPASALTQATDRLKAAQAALASESAKQLAAIQPTNVAYGTAQISLQHLNSELQAAQAQFSAASAAAQSSASATAATSGAANTAATAQQNLAGATMAAAAATQAQTAAAGANIGAIMAGANAAQVAAGAANQIPPAQNAAVGSTFRLIAALALLKRGLREIDEVRQAEMELLHLSEATGISAQTFAQFQGAINRAGGDGDKFAKAVVFLARSIEQGERGVKTMSDELQRLGVTSKNPVEAFYQIADAIHNTKDKSEALAAASRVLGRGEQELIGIMGQGSASLREYFGQSEELAKARVAAISSAQQLTAVEAEVKAQLTEMAVSILPLVTTGLKIVATAFSALNIPVKIVASAILATFAGAINAGKNFGIVLSDLAHGKWDMIRVDAGIALDGIRDDFAKFSKDIGARTEDSVNFIGNLWKKAGAASQPGAGLAFPAPKTTGGKTPEHLLRKQFEDELAEMKADHEVTVNEEKRFWEERYAIAMAKGAAFADLQVDIHRKIGALNQQAIRQFHEAEIHEVVSDAKDFQDQLAAVMNSAEETTGMPKTAGLDFIRAKLEAETISQGAYEQALKKIPELERGAAKESEEVIRHWVKASEDIFAEGGVRTAAEASAHAARMIAVLQQLGGMEDEVAAQQKRKNAADRQVVKQTLQIKQIDASGEAADAETNILAKKIGLESEYAQHSFHTSQQQIAYAQEISNLEQGILALKRDAALADFDAATFAGDGVAMARAASQWLKEDDAIRLHRLQTEAQIAEIAHKNSFGGQISAGLTKDAESAVSRISSGIATLSLQTKGWGQEFKNVLKDIERSLIETFAHAALKQGLNALLNAGQPKQSTGSSVGGGVAQGAVVAALTANTAATSGNAAVTGAHAGIMGSHLGVMASHLGVMLTHTGVMLGHLAAMIANTVATIANTIATAIKGFLGFLTGGAAKGGKPKAGESWIVGEEGPEVVTFGQDATVHPHGKSMQMLAEAQQGVGSFKIPQGIFDVPGAPASAFISANQAQSISSSSANSVVTNQNTGTIGAVHVHVNGTQNPREVARQIANEIKRATPKYSPVSG